MLPVFRDAGYSEQKVYFDTPSCGLPPDAAVEAMIQSAKQWGAGEHFTSWEQMAEECRSEFALQRGLDRSWIGLIPSVVPAVSVAATTLARRPGVVVAHRMEFRSLLLPFLNAFGEERIRWVEGDYTAHSFTSALDNDVVAVIASSVASHNGARLDLAHLGDKSKAADAALIVDATQSEGIVTLGIPYTQCFLVVTAGYKGLLGPRGTGYAIAQGAAWSRHASPSPYGMQDTGRTGSYGPPLLPFPGGRGLEQSPAWQCWGAAKAALSFLTSAASQVELHVLDLTSRLREGLQSIGIPAQPTDLASPIVSVPVADPIGIRAALLRTNIHAAVRVNRLRLGVHGYNSAEQIDRALDVLNTTKHLIMKDK